jgi:Protein of unknown function with HXXEE motif
MRWHYRDGPLLWVFPPAYLAHLAEEVWAGPGFPEWFALVAGRPLPRGAFAAINLIAFAVLLAGIRAAIHRESAGWIAIAIASVVSLNALLHIAGSVLTGTYSPGLITGVVLYLPAGQLLLIRGLHQVEPPRFIRGVMAGIAIQIAVVIAAMLISRWQR